MDDNQVKEEVLEQETDEAIEEAEEIVDDTEDADDDLGGFEFDEDGNIIVDDDAEDEDNAEADEQAED